LIYSWGWHISGDVKIHTGDKVITRLVSTPVAPLQKKKFTYGVEEAEELEGLVRLRWVLVVRGMFLFDSESWNTAAKWRVEP